MPSQFRAQPDLTYVNPKTGARISFTQEQLNENPAIGFLSSDFEIEATPPPVETQPAASQPPATQQAVPVQSITPQPTQVAPVPQATAQPQQVTPPQTAVQQQQPVDQSQPLPLLPGEREAQINLYLQAGFSREEAEARVNELFAGRQPAPTSAQAPPTLNFAPTGQQVPTTVQQPATPVRQATLFNPQTGERRAIAVGSQEAQQLFGQGFQLETPENNVQTLQQAIQALQQPEQFDLAIEQEGDITKPEKAPSFEEQVNTILERFGITPPDPGADPFSSFVETYKEVFVGFGLSEIQAEAENIADQMQELQDEKNEAIQAVNDDPFLTEGLRRNRIDGINRRFEGRETNLLGRLRIQQGLLEEGRSQAQFIVNEAIGAQQTQRKLEQDAVFEAMRIAEDRVKAERDIAVETQREERAEAREERLAVQAERTAKLSEQRLQFDVAKFEADIRGATRTPTPDIQEYNLSVGQGFQGSFLEFKRAQALAESKTRISAPPTPTNDMKEYLLARSQGFKGSFLEYLQLVKPTRTTTVKGDKITAGEYLERYPSLPPEVIEMGEAQILAQLKGTIPPDWFAASNNLPLWRRGENLTDVQRIRNIETFQAWQKFRASALDHITKVTQKDTFDISSLFQNNALTETGLGALATEHGIE